MMKDKKELIGVMLYDRDEKLTQQVKIVLPKHYISSLDLIANELNIRKRFIIWDAIGNYLQDCQKVIKPGLPR